MEHISKHAAQRCAQRAIPEVVIDLLYRFGKCERSHGANRYSFDKRGRKQLQAYLGSCALKEMSKIFNAFIVEGDDGTLVTAGYRQARRCRSPR